MRWSPMGCAESVGGKLAALALLALLWPGPALGQDLDPELAQAEAKATVRMTLDEVVGVLQDESLSPEQKRERTEEVAYKRFDFETISRLVLARNWRRLSAEQRSDFVTEFKRHLSLTYGDTLQEYQDETFTVDRTRFEKRGDVTVRTTIVGASVDPIVVDYRLRKKQDGWYIIDVITESVSLIVNFRSQTKEIISQSGPGGLIDRLREKNEKRESQG